MKQKTNECNLISSQSRSLLKLSHVVLYISCCLKTNSCNPLQKTFWLQACVFEEYDDFFACLLLLKFLYEDIYLKHSNWHWSWLQTYVVCSVRFCSFFLTLRKTFALLLDQESEIRRLICDWVIFVFENDSHLHERVIILTNLNKKGNFTSFNFMVDLPCLLLPFDI